VPTVPDFLRSTPSLRAYFTAIKAALPPDVVWEGAANEVVPPLLRAVDGMDDAARLRVMNDADRVGAMANEAGEAALYAVAKDPACLDALENSHARALWMFLNDVAGFNHAEEVRYTGAATDCEYEVAWAQTYAIGIDYTATATRAGNAVYNRHRAPASRMTRLLANIPNLRAAAFRHSNTEIGVEGACIIATSTTTETTMAALSWNGLDGIAATGRGLLLNANRGVAFVVQTTHAKEFALAHWLVGGADGGRLCVRCFDGAGTVRENQPQDVLASGTTMQWDTASKSWQAGAVMQDSSLNRRQTVRLGPGVAFAQIGIIGFDGQIELEALRLYGLPEDAPAILYGCPSLPAGTRTLALETSWDLPSLGPGATANVDVTVPGARRGDFADASLDTSSIAFVLDCHVWSNNSVRVTARNVSASTVDLAAAPLAVQVTKRRAV
jgi:hypothetical protein